MYIVYENTFQCAREETLFCEIVIDFFVKKSYLVFYGYVEKEEYGV